MRLADILKALEDHLVELLSIARGESLPHEEENNMVLETSELAGESSSETSDDTYPPSIDDESSTHEVNFRLESITDSIDALYSLAIKILNPRNRPQRTINPCPSRNLDTVYS
jgi:hypothetical protein